MTIGLTAPHPMRAPRVEPYGAARAVLCTPLIEGAVASLCLAALGLHFYRTAGRFLDQDEIYFFHVSHAVARGVPLYDDLQPYYPPVLFHLGAALFTLFGDLYAGLLGARILVITCGLIGFFFVFDIYRRLRLTSLIVPVAFVIPLLTQFDLKLMEFRADNLVCPIIAAQAWCIFLLNEGTARPDRTLSAVLWLGLLSLHLSQKAVPSEGALVIVLIVTQYSTMFAFVRRHWIALSMGALAVAGALAWWAAYRLFVERAYVDAVPLMAIYQLGDGRQFLLACLERNLGFWLLAALSALAIAEGLPTHPRRNLLPLMLLIAAAVLVYASSFPYLHYQLYLAWAALLALPFAARVIGDLFDNGTVAALVLCGVAAGSSWWTSQRFAFPHEPLEEYAHTVERARRAVGSEAVGFVGGTLISASSVWPQDPINGYRYHRDYVVEQRWRMSDRLQATAAKFVFDPRALIREQAAAADRVFIGLNYRSVPELPLLMASAWHWFGAGRSSFAVDIGGPYRTWVFGGGGTTRIDGATVGGGATLQLDVGVHTVETAAPGVVLLEFASPSLESVEVQEITGARGAEFEAVDTNFSDEFRLLGVLRLEEDTGDVFHVFWKKTADADAELLAFHHFRDGAGNFVAGENVDPGAGWYRLRELQPGQAFSYRFRVAKGLKARRLDIGLYQRDDIARRILCGREGYFTVGLTQSEMPGAGIEPAQGRTPKGF